MTKKNKSDFGEMPRMKVQDVIQLAMSRGTAVVVEEYADDLDSVEKARLTLLFAMEEQAMVLTRVNAAIRKIKAKQTEKKKENIITNPYPH